MENKNHELFFYKLFFYSQDPKPVAAIQNFSDK